MRNLFISYARENKPSVDQLVDHLGVVGYQTWVDSSLRGGQDWWQEILRRIADCDVFIAIISPEALNSTACGREREWAAALGKPMLPVAVEPLSTALPKSLSTLQIIDYSDHALRDRAALMLAGALAALPATPAPTDLLPEPPEAPLSYLTDLVDQVARPDSIDHERQRQIVSRLETALRSVDPEERRGGVDILQRFRGRGDLYADVDRALSQLDELYTDASRFVPAKAVRPPPQPTPKKSRVEHQSLRVKAALGATTPDVGSTEITAGTPVSLRIPGALVITFAGLSLILTAVEWFSSSWLWSLYPAAWDGWWASVSKLILTALLAVAFGLLARALKRVTGNRMAAAYAGVVSGTSGLLTVVGLVRLGALSRGDEASIIVALVVFLGLIAFGIAATMELRRPWPLLATAAGVFGAAGAAIGAFIFGSIMPYVVCLLWLPLLLAFGIAMVRFRPDPAAQPPSLS